MFLITQLLVQLVKLCINIIYISLFSKQQ